MTTSLKSQLLKKELSGVEGLNISDSQRDIERFSKDFFDYSPILFEQLNTCLADLIVKPSSLEAIIAVARACKKNNVPLTLRGSGTGNYGQCVPLNGGVVMLMSEFKKIRRIDPISGEVTVESGCLLRDLNNQLATKGRQLRILPSTWRSASIAGFVSGGSGGIGSVRWGFLRDPGNLLGLEIITVEDSPRKLTLDVNKSEPLNHAYGTNGIITALTLATSPLIEWQEVAIDFKEWIDAVDFMRTVSQAAIELFLCSLLQKDIIEQIPAWSGKYNGCHRLLILVASDGLTTLERLATSAGAIFNYLGPENEKQGTGLRELTWNHTTLQMRAVDTDWTYLQMLLPQPELKAMNSLSKKWRKDLLWHLEAVRQQGSQRLAALPLVKWRGKKFMDQLIHDCRDAGAIIFNPHTITVEDGGLGVIDVDQVEAKKLYDPEGILNPGKLKGWLH